MLALFDVDGTLLQTSGVDDECFARAVADVFGYTGISTDWGAYSDSTDAGILDDVLRARRGTGMTPADAAAQRSRFVELLEDEARRRPERFAPTPGAAEALRAARDAGWACGLATGGWRASALLKLRVGGLDVTDLPAAFADDARSREEIVRIAATRAGATAAHWSARRVAYVGDGVWDVRAAQRVGAAFLGVAHGERADRLRAAGAETVVRDFVAGGEFPALLAGVTGVTGARAKT